MFEFTVKLIKLYIRVLTNSNITEIVKNTDPNIYLIISHEKYI
jgi:hypothetical protein